MSSARRVSAIAVSLLVAGAAAACSSSSSSSAPASSAPGTAAAAGASASGTTSGAPVTLMVIYVGNGPEANSPEDVAGAQAAALAINANGGINGHPVKIVACNDQFNPNVAAQCARTAAADHVAAVVGNKSTNGAVIDPILQQENIPSVGNNPIVALDNTSPISFPLISGAFFNYPGQAIEMIKNLDKKRIVVAEYNLAAVEPIGKVVQQAVTAAGGVNAGTVLLPQTATDMTSFAAQIVAMKADGVDCITSPQAALALLKAARQLGSQAVFSYIDGTMTPQMLQSAGTLADGMALAGYLPPVSATNIPGVAEFVSEMAAAAKAGIPNASGGNIDPVSENGWLSVYAVQAVAKSIQGPVTSTSVLAALKQAKNINLKGLVPDWSPGVAGPTGYAQITNPTVWLGVVKNSQTQLIQNTPLNVASVLGLG
jgi:branched-chain amino acid transport system substrate-binding protein